MKSVQARTDAHRAYARIAEDDAERTKKLEASLDELLALSRECGSDLLEEMKPTIAVALKWRFDYLAKTYGSPFEMEGEVEYWKTAVRTLSQLGDLEWFNKRDDAAASGDVWRRTAHGFDVGWTTTTKEERFAASRRTADERLDQLVEMLGGSKYFKGKTMLDSGCGPGRYIDLIRKFSPKKITGMVQGECLVEVLKERFKGDPLAEVHRGTSEKLTYPDASFDIVFSNGVIHHTPAHLPTMIADQARALMPGGVMFIMLVGKGGLELKFWEFVRGFLYHVSVESMLDRFGPKMSPLVLQRHLVSCVRRVSADRPRRVRGMVPSALQGAAAGAWHCRPRRVARDLRRRPVLHGAARHRTHALSLLQVNRRPER